MVLWIWNRAENDSCSRKGDLGTINITQGPESHLKTGQTAVYLAQHLLLWHHTACTWELFSYQEMDNYKLRLKWVQTDDHVGSETWKDFNRDRRVFTARCRITCENRFLRKSDYVHMIPKVILDSFSRESRTLLFISSFCPSSFIHVFLLPCIFNVLLIKNMLNFHP